MLPVKDMLGIPALPLQSDTNSINCRDNPAIQ